MSTSRSDIRDRLAELDTKRAALYTVLVGLILFYLAPLQAGLMTAFKTQEAFARTIPFAPPPVDGFTFTAVETAWAALAPTALATAIVVIPATIMSGVLGSLAGYGLTTLNWRNQIIIVLLFVAGIFIPYQSVLVPLSRFWYNWFPLYLWFESAFGGLITNADGVGQLISLSITHTAYGVSLTTLLFRSYYQKFSDEMIEAARLDGANAVSIYKNIILPLSRPMFAVVLIYQFTQVYNDLLFALILLNDPNSKVATLQLNALLGGIIQEFNLQMAGAFIAALPTLLVYIFFGDQFARGVAGET